ncbi:unnamed protein product [Lampetra fluviatilis]
MEALAQRQGSERAVVGSVSGATSRSSSSQGYGSIGSGDGKDADGPLGRRLTPPTSLPPPPPLLLPPLLTRRSRCAGIDSAIRVGNELARESTRLARVRPAFSS